MRTLFDIVRCADASGRSSELIFIGDDTPLFDTVEGFDFSKGEIFETKGDLLDIYSEGFISADTMGYKIFFVPTDEAEAVKQYISQPLPCFQL